MTIIDKVAGGASGSSVPWPPDCRGERTFPAWKDNLSHVHEHGGRLRLHLLGKKVNLPFLFCLFFRLGLPFYDCILIFLHHLPVSMVLILKLYPLADQGAGNSALKCHTPCMRLPRSKICL
ncbi:hypothetical membrane protein [Syntrophus aciditrophicus SB]|uniref:Hypothetical membrane protein n=1 Tax=Syntrophus aciditrophicus (strain SB) TaxID=56780 RepID=Q2LQ72_SYNAS|nr:hypothetical membrane protein [Syntrophus aciditrophicus SB]